MKSLLLILKGIFFSALLSCQVFAQQNLQNQIKLLTNQPKSYQKIGKTLLDFSSLRKLYEVRSYQKIWIQDNKLSEQAYQFIALLKNPEEFGFQRSEWWDKELENIIAKSEKQGLESASQVWYEVYLSDLAIKFAKAIWQGRNIDPDIVDDDVKFKRKTFDKYDLLNLILSFSNDHELKEMFQLIEPKNHLYRKMKLVMKQLLKSEESGLWKKVEVANENRVPGSRSLQIHDLKRQMAIYGFKFTKSEQGMVSDEYDQELVKAIEQYHQLFKTGGKGLNESLIKSMNTSLESRKSQVRLALEKTRWLPDELETNHIFVNLAFQELRLFEGERVALEMKTVNGQKYRRTPMMRDVVSVVELNPTWTVPYNIAIKDKLPKLRQNPYYLSEHQMKLIDNNTRQELSGEEIDWSHVDKDNFNFTIIQGSGAENALGLVKFPLTNPWSIYLHDTNERHLFSNSQRLLSSGCVRLEKPFELANYLLKDRPDFSAEKINEIINKSISEASDITPTRIKVRRTLPVYTLFLTVELSEQGVVRFADDAYGSDYRLRLIVDNQNKFEDKIPLEYVQGEALTVREGLIVFKGKSGEQQFAKGVDLYKCIKDKKRSCEYVGNLALGKTYKVQSGDYLGIYENTMSPDFITVDPSQMQEVDLVSVKTPEAFKEDVNLRLFKDLSKAEEQIKILREIYYFKNSPFKYTQLDGDFYLATAKAKVVNQRYDYSYCLNKNALLSDEGREVCDIYRNANSELDLSYLVSFENSSSSSKLSLGQYSQVWVTRPGDRVKILNKRILLSAPFSGADSVLAFPGRYKLQSDNQKATVDVVAR